jgi:hypothetical protein
VGNGVEERRARRPTAAHALPREGGAAGPGGGTRCIVGPTLHQRPMGPARSSWATADSQWRLAWCYFVWLAPLWRLVSRDTMISKPSKKYTPLPALLVWTDAQFDTRGCSLFSRPVSHVHVGPRWSDIACLRLRFARPRGASAARTSFAWGPLAPLHASHAYPICNIWSTFETSKCNTCNIQKEIDEIFETCVLNTCKNNLKHLKTIANMRNIQIKYLQHMCKTYATSR